MCIKEYNDYITFFENYNQLIAQIRDYNQQLITKCQRLKTILLNYLVL
jgi:hypothetical protein